MDVLSRIPEEGRIFMFLAASSVIKAVSLQRLSSIRHHQPQPVGSVKALRLFPLKSAGAVKVNYLHCDYTGFFTEHDVHDRSWMVATSDYQFVTARTEGTLMLIKPHLEGNKMVLTAPGMDRLEVPIIERGTLKQVFTKVHGQPSQGVDCGDEAGRWISDFLHKPGHRLLHSPHWLEKRFVNNGPTKYHKVAEDKDKVAFQDMSPCSLMNDSSMTDLASRLPVPVTEDNFRANILIEGCSEYQEDNFLEVYIGGAVFKRLKQTDRCLLTTVNPATGKKYGNQDEPLHSMKSFRMLPGYATPCFCLSLAVSTPGSVKVGDEVKVTYG